MADDDELADLKAQFELFKASIETERKDNEDLKAKNLELQKNLEIAATLLKSAKGNTIIVKDKKIPKLGFRDCEIDVDTWIADVRQYFDSKTLSNEQMCDFIFENTKGEIKEELRYRGKGKSHEELLVLIQENFTQITSLAALQRKFYERSQLEKESVFVYALALLKICDKIRQMESSDATKKDISDYNSVLKDRFTEGVRDEHLKRELRGLQKEHPKLDFYDFRSRAINWLGEKGMSPEVSTYKETVQSENQKSSIASSADLYDIIQKQGQDIKELRDKMSQDVFVDELSHGRPYVNKGPTSYQDRNFNQGQSQDARNFRDQGQQSRRYEQPKQVFRYDQPPPPGPPPSQAAYNGKRSDNRPRFSASQNGNSNRNSVSPSYSAPSRQVDGTKNYTYQSRPRYDGPSHTQNGTVICYKCQGLNHLARNCMKLN